MIPTAILAGLVLGFWLRWWAVPIVAAGWAIVIAFVDPSAIAGAALLGGLNAAVGTVPAVGVRHLLRPTRPADHR